MVAAGPKEKMGLMVQDESVWPLLLKDRIIRKTHKKQRIQAKKQLKNKKQKIRDKKQK